MAKSLIQLNVFISSPSELEAERAITLKAIEDATQSLTPTNGIILKPLTWEADVIPGIGQEVQEVISSQIDSAYDIYVGLLGSYFGTPTKKAGSGTEDEFRQAYKLYQDHPEQIRILIYFRDTSSDIYKIDLQQFEKVKTFRNDLKQLGVLYDSFTDTEDLYKKITSHLRGLIQKQWIGSEWKVLSSAPISDLAINEGGSAISIPVSKVALLETKEDGDNEDGFFELLTSGIRAAEQIGIVLESMTAASTAFQESVQARSLEITEATVGGQPAMQIQVFDGLAEDLTSYEMSFREKVPVLDAALDDSLFSFATLSRLITSEAPQAKAALIEVFPSFKGMVKTVRETRETVTSLQGSIASAPPMTKKLRIAKRRLIEAIEGLAVSVTVFGVKADVVIREIETALELEPPPDSKSVNSRTVSV